MKKQAKKYFYHVLYIVIACNGLYQSAYSSDLSGYENCLVQKIAESNADLNVSEVVDLCERFKTITDDDRLPLNFNSAIQHRLRSDQQNLFQPFTIMAYKPNYIMPVVYNYSGYDASLYRQQFSDPSISLDDEEAQFQISFKAPLATQLFGKNHSIYVGYTNRSFWQVYNKDLSSPFRETNHEPELWLQMVNDSNFMGFRNIVNILGFSHQSNGRGGLLSRSWNRAYVRTVFEKGYAVISLKLWARFQESADKDDNPDITDFLGHSELRFNFKNDKGHTFSLMSRNNLESSFDHGAVELSWSFPLQSKSNFKGYIQLFSGYGESLIDYNKSVNRAGFGITLSDWL